MRRISIAVLALSSFICGISCTKAKLEEAYNRQESQIDQYVTGELSKSEGYPVPYTVSYNDGTTRLTKTPGTGDRLSPSGTVSFYYAGYTFKGSINASNLFTTNHQETAETSNWTVSDPDYSLMKVSGIEDAELIEGLKRGLAGVQQGEECEILFSGKYAFGKSKFGIIPAGSALAFKIWVTGVANN